MTGSDPSKSMWPYGIVAALVVAVTINLWMVTIAISHPSIPLGEDSGRGPPEVAPCAGAQATLSHGQHAEPRR